MENRSGPAILFCLLTLAACDDTRPVLEPAPPLPPAPSSGTASGLNGAYTVTFSAAEECTDIGAELQQRTYLARIQPMNARTDDVVLSGADFYAGHETFMAMADGGLVRFFISSSYAMSAWLDDEPIVERLPEGRYLAILGTANAPVSFGQGPVTLAFSGSFSYCSAALSPAFPTLPPGCASPIVCKSANHKLTIAR